MTAVPLAAAAAELGVRVGTLRRWTRQGCPVVQRGSRGRGHALLLDVETVRTWSGAAGRDALVLEVAAEIPSLLATAAAESLQRASGVDKRALAGILVGSWYLATIAIVDRLRELNPAIPEPDTLPAEIERLRKIARNE